MTIADHRPHVHDGRGATGEAARPAPTPPGEPEPTLPSCEGGALCLAVDQSGAKR